MTAKSLSGLLEKKHTSRIMIAIFVIAMGLRLSLALVNREANDDHTEVVSLILKNGVLPIQNDCWECFQPKLFHGTVALVAKLLSLQDMNALIVAGQLINVSASIFMLWYLWKIILQMDFVDEWAKVLGFGVIALNPALVAINIQSTNDTFVITFSVIASYYAYLFIVKKSYRNFILCTILSVMSILSKTNGMITAGSIALAFFILAIYQRDFSWHGGKSNLASGIIFGITVFFLVITNPLGQYVQNYQIFGSPVTLNINVDTQPFPSLFEKTDTYRPGILSLQDGFLTFKLLELMKDPQTSSDNKEYAPHRTSFWTLLFARGNFIHYLSSPPSWATTRMEVKVLGRLIFFFALLPMGLIFIGTLRETRNLLKMLIWPDCEIFPGIALFIPLLLGYLAFLILYALEYRMYMVIKPIFIYPALPAIGYMYMSGYVFITKIARSNGKWIAPGLMLATTILLGLYILDALVLFLQLTLFK
jgi:hypothetical protein